MCQQAVDGEVTPEHVLLGSGERDLGRVPPVVVGSLGTERGPLHRLVILNDQDHAERGANLHRVREQAHHDVWRGRGRDVVVGRRKSQQAVADATTGKAGLVAMVQQDPCHGAGRGQACGGGKDQMRIVHLPIS
jgi:hypothetical protein